MMEKKTFSHKAKDQRRELKKGDRKGGNEISINNLLTVINKPLTVPVSVLNIFIREDIVSNILRGLWSGHA